MFINMHMTLKKLRLSHRSSVIVGPAQSTAQVFYKRLLKQAMAATDTFKVGWQEQRASDCSTLKPQSLN